MSLEMPIVSAGTRSGAIAGSSAAAAAADVVQIHRLADDQVAVGVEAAHQLVAVVIEVALDLESLPQVEACRPA